MEDNYFTTLWWFFTYIDMNQQVDMGVYVSPIPKSHPAGSSQCTGFEGPVLCIKLELVIYFTYGNIHVLMLFSQIIPPSPSPTESKSLFSISVSLLLSHIQGHHCHISKFHIYRLYTVFVFFFLTSLCKIGSSIIHIIRTDSNVFFLMVE